MFGLRYGKLALASAVTLFAVSLSIPAQADGTPQDASGITEVSSADVPTPRARPAVVRKRVASAAPIYRQSEPPRVVRPYERVAAHWILFLGVGY